MEIRERIGKYRRSYSPLKEVSCTKRIGRGLSFARSKCLTHPSAPSARKWMATKGRACCEAADQNECKIIALDAATHSTNVRKISLALYHQQKNVLLSSKHTRSEQSGGWFACVARLLRKFGVFSPFFFVLSKREARALLREPARSGARALVSLLRL